MELKNETVSQDRNDKSGLNPVEFYVEILCRIRSYPNVSNNWQIFAFFGGSSFFNISGRDILMEIWSSVDCIGEDSLGFTSADVGNHSVRASPEMMMLLTKELIYTIMIIGRWSSDTFLAYIENKIK